MLEEKLVARGLARWNGEGCSKVISLNINDLAMTVNS